MGFDWKMFAADFLTEVTEDIEERQDEAKEYLKEQKDNLSKERGKSGAVEKLAYIIFNSIKRFS